ncbi:hypothetical protein ACFT5B_14155 [Luteimicrobium sp. NPDC057192]|uniref:hypothetical protein n=1 Tax=Luteimicrobium sp. NPDC057192 TaxID=3346042 RepID=UPI003629ACF2
MGLIYELTAATYDATEQAAWTSTADGAVLEAVGGRLRVHADNGTVNGAVQRDQLDAPPGRYVLVIDVLTATDLEHAASATIGANLLFAQDDVRSNIATRYVLAMDVGDLGLAPSFRFIITNTGNYVYVDRLAIYAVDGGPLLGQLGYQILTPGDEGFVLNRDELDTGALGDTATATAWTEYLCDATGVSINRGASVDGVTTTTQVGTANLTVYAQPDQPPGLGLRPNLPVRIRSKLTETVAYTGNVGDLTDTWRRSTTSVDRRFIANVPALDAVRDLAGITRYGALGIDRWSDRVRRVMASYRGRWDFAPGTRPDAYWPVCSRTVYESTLDKHLQLIANTSAGRWYVDRDNVVRIELSNWSAQERPIRLEFSDEHDEFNPRHRCYVDVVRTYDTRSLVNDLTLANHDAALNDQGQWQADDAGLGPFQDVTSAATWGVRHADVETSLETGPGDPDADAVPTADPVGDLVTEYTRDLANPAVRFTSVTYNATKDVDVACSLDVFDLVLVTNNGLTQQSRVIGIQHVITPDKWLVTLALQAWSVS